MSSDLVIQARGLGKAYYIYRRPEDRLKQILYRKRKRFYEEFWALRNIDLDIRPGETTALIGCNGSGKSTLLQLLCGTLAPSCGELSVKGRIAALLELGAGFNPEFTGHENIELAASILGLNQDEIRQRYQSIIDFAGIGDFIHQPVKLYSSGMYARLAFAVAAHVDADILIVDEILSVGDAAFTQKCMRYIRKFKERGTLLFVSHDMGAVTNLCDRAVWLHQGEVQEIGPAREVCFNYMSWVEGEKDPAGFEVGETRKRSPDGVVPAPTFTKGLLQEAGLVNLGTMFDFDSNAHWMGRRKISIIDLAVLNTRGERITAFEGGEELEINVVAEAHEAVEQPIVGFIVKDRLGQALFGENTFLCYRNQRINLAAGERIRAGFRFYMPFLQTGDYTISLAIATGSQLDHVQQHWMEDAMVFRVVSNHLVRGLVGIPFLSIDLSKITSTSDHPRLPE